MSERTPKQENGFTSFARGFRNAILGIAGLGALTAGAIWSSAVNLGGTLYGASYEGHKSMTKKPA